MEIEKLRKEVKRREKELENEKKRRKIEEEEFLSCTQDLITKLMAEKTERTINLNLEHDFKPKRKSRS